MARFLFVADFEQKLAPEANHDMFSASGFIHSLGPGLLFLQEYVVDQKLPLDEAWERFRKEAHMHFGDDAHGPLILECWQRSRGQRTQQDAGKVLLRRVGRYELQERRYNSAMLLNAAGPALAGFIRRLEGGRYVLYLTDADAIVLDSYGNATELMIQGRMPGYDWSEQTMGTNGAGTALATGRPVAVLGPENYMLPYHAPACLGAPIKVRGEKLIGAVVFSTNVSSATPAHLADLMGVAARIERTIRTGTARAATG